MSESVDPDVYIRTYFLLSKGVQLTFDDEYHRKNDFVLAFEGLIHGALERHGNPIANRYRPIADYLVEQIIKAGGFREQSDPLAGSYYQFVAKNYEQWRVKTLSVEPLTQRYEQVGARFWDDAFAGLSSLAEAQAISEDGIQIVPASDRLVSLDHNQPEYLEVSEALSSALTEVAVVNAANQNGENRASVLGGLRAAEALWDATELRVMQLKVGVILALEASERFLGRTLKTVSGALVVDLIKAILKKSAGLDLDNL